VLTNSEGITLPVVAADGSAVRDVTVTSDTAQDGDVLKTTGRNTSYTNVTRTQRHVRLGRSGWRGVWPRLATCH
jgi:hypothetical protein